MRVQVAVFLDEDTLFELKKVSRKEEKTRSQLIEELITEGLEKKENKNPSKQAKLRGKKIKR